MFEKQTNSNKTSILLIIIMYPSMCLYIYMYEYMCVCYDNKIISLTVIRLTTTSKQQNKISITVAGLKQKEKRNFKITFTVDTKSLNGEREHVPTKNFLSSLSLSFFSLP